MFNQSKNRNVHPQFYPTRLSIILQTSCPEPGLLFNDGWHLSSPAASSEDGCLALTAGALLRLQKVETGSEPSCQC